MEIKSLAIINEDDPKVMELITQQIARGATPLELNYFIAVCNRMRLDPFAKQIWAVKRWDSNAGGYVLGIQTGIDGFRAVADRSDLYEGQTAPVWCGPDGVWKDVWLNEEPPMAAKVGVYRRGFREPTYAIVKYDAVVQMAKDKKTQEWRPNAFWAKMPDHMLAKCAEAQALRKAFPNDCGGIYSSDEYVPEEPELADPGKRAEARMNKIQEEIEKAKAARDVTPNEENKTPPVEEIKPNIESSDQQSPVPNTQPEEPKKIRNFAAGELAISPQFATLHNFKFVKNVPEKNAKAYILKAKDWAESSKKPMPEAMIEMISALESFWGI